jgi:hypothetical protein
LARDCLIHHPPRLQHHSLDATPEISRKSIAGLLAWFAASQFALFCATDVLPIVWTLDPGASCTPRYARVAYPRGKSLPNHVRDAPTIRGRRLLTVCIADGTRRARLSQNLFSHLLISIPSHQLFSLYTSLIVYAVTRLPAACYIAGCSEILPAAYIYTPNFRHLPTDPDIAPP